MFKQKDNVIYTTILIDVDDVVIVGNNIDRIQKIKKQLDESFSIKDLNTLKYSWYRMAKAADRLVFSQ